MEEAKSSWEKLHKIALKAPICSGVYLWRDAEKTVIYVGKAIVLKNRLLSYFSGKKDVKTRSLIAHASSIEYITTKNEYEALILENNLIKQYSPRYNICLKDGKTYPMLRITNEDFPRVFKTRYLVSDGSKYYGPFPNVSALDNFIQMIDRTYKLRKCRKLQKRKTPCLYYHISRCSAPCCEYIDKEAYKKPLAEIITFLECETEENGVRPQKKIINCETEQNGVRPLFAATPVPEYNSQNSEVTGLKKLEFEMKEAAAHLQFEKAARLRDGINAVCALRAQNAVEDFDPEGRDYIAFASRGILVTFIVLNMRNGRLTGRDLFQTRSLNHENELLPEFLLSYYGNGREIPSKIFVTSPENLELAKAWFVQEIKKRPNILIPNNSRHESVMAMAQLNAKEDIARRIREKGDVVAMEELQELCGLQNIPRHIEGFDIAHISGRFPVASLIYFQDGNPVRSQYRYFRLKTTNGLIDDFASMREAVTRRYTRLVNENQELPDFILIDGGAGQVSAVENILESLGLDIPIAGLAKQNEEIYLPGKIKPIRLQKSSEALKLLERIRDETHRFATGLNQKLRTKENTVSVFQSLSGIGPQKSKILMNEFCTLENLIRSDPEKISELLKISKEKALFVLSEAKKLQKKQIEEATMRETIDTGGEKVSNDMLFEAVNSKKDELSFAKRIAEKALLSE